MARYKLVKDEDLNITDVRINDASHPVLAEGTVIPNTPGNRYWVQYETWAETNTPDAADTIDYLLRMRTERDLRLSVCDWTQGNDSPLIEGDKILWATYRQELRDMPQNNPSVPDKAAYDALVWPVAP